MRMQFTGQSVAAVTAAVTTPMGVESYHDTLGAVRVSVRELGGDPDAQVGITIGVMRERVGQDAGEQEFKEWAVGVCGDGDDIEKVGRAYDHVKSALTFQRDEVNAAQLQGIDPNDVVEVIIRPVDMKRYVEQGKSTGDCDDFSMYLACLLECVGVPCSFVTVAADAQAPYQYSHVYVAAYPEVDGSRVRVPLDASHGDGPGWEADQVVEVKRKTEWSVGNALGWVMEAVGLALVGWVVWYMAGEAKRT
jgi:hypothetical protein